ncbi:MAG: hypothetical protein ACK4HQ_00705 [Brevinematales bacterium]
MKKLCFLCLLTSISFSQIIEESNLFQEDTFITEAPLLTNTPSKGIFLTGIIQSQFSYSFDREKLTNKESQATNHLSYEINGDIFVDIRQGTGYKAFFDVGFLTTHGGFPVFRTFADSMTATSYLLIETNTFAFQIKESFVDFPLLNLFYFRFGKQFLNWGTTYFWNPTDLLNRERKHITTLNNTRQGIWGIKLHVPYKTLINWYTFLDMTDVLILEEAALASRLETVLGHTEIGLGGWWRKGYVSVYGGDLSTRLWEWDIKAEGSLSYGENRPILKENIFSLGTSEITNYTTEKVSNTWVYRIALNLSRSWEIGNVKDRLSTMVEVFYNSQGKNDQLFTDPMKTQAALHYGAYVPNEYTHWYAFFSMGIKKIFISELSSQMYLLWNIEDHSALFKQQLTYSPAYETQVNLGLMWSFGEKDREYTSTDTPLTLIANFSIQF